MRFACSLAALLILGLALIVQLVTDRAGGTFLRPLVFDGYQRLMPRSVERFPVRVIDVDKSGKIRLSRKEALESLGA